jgi:hypothetical protein
MENSPDKAEEIFNGFLAKYAGNITSGEIFRFEFALPGLSIAKYHKPYDQLLAEVRAGDVGSIDQYCELYRVWLRSFSPNAQGSNVKGNPAHTILIYAGLVGGGIENLNEDEMADLFDQYCFCKQEHSGEALVKMRSRLARTLKKKAYV